MVNGYTGTMINCILWGNTDPNGVGESAQIIADSNMSVSNCCIQGLDTLAGNGNIGVNPLFVDSNGVDGEPGTGDEDLRFAV